jgi:hypothetical protein
MIQRLFDKYLNFGRGKAGMQTIADCLPYVILRFVAIPDVVKLPIRVFSFRSRSKNGDQHSRAQPRFDICTFRPGQCDCVSYVLPIDVILWNVSHDTRETQPE